MIPDEQIQTTKKLNTNKMLILIFSVIQNTKTNQSQILGV